MRQSRLVVAGLAALIVAGCSSSPVASTPATSAPATSATASTPPPSAKPELSAITVGLLPAVATSTLYLAIKEGYFRQAGLTVTPKQLASSTDAIPSMLHGSIAISSGNLDSYLAADASGVLPVRILNETVLCSPGTLALLTTPRTHITSTAQLAGKTIAVPGAVNINTLTLDRLLGTALVKTVHFTVIPPANMAAALAAGRVDAISTLEPYIHAAEHSDGATVLLDQCGGANADIPLGGYFTTASWAAKYPNTARAFQQAINKAQALANSDPALVRQILPTFTAITPQVAAVVGLPQFATSLNAAAIQGVADLARTGGEIKTQIDVQPLLFS